MAEENKKRRKRTKSSSGRVTEKGTRPKSAKQYVPPAPEPYQPSSKWVPIFMFGFFGLGVMVIVLNYLPGDLLPGGTQDRNLLIGLGLVCLGFVAATRYR